MEYRRGNYTKVFNLLDNTNNDPFSLSLLGSSEFAINHLSKAVFYYHHILKLNVLPRGPGLGIVMKNLALLYCMNHQLEPMQACLENALSLLDYSPSILYWSLFCRVSLRPSSLSELHNCLFLLKEVEQYEDALEPSHIIQMKIWKINLLLSLHLYDDVVKEVRSFLTIQGVSSYQIHQVLLYQAEASIQNGQLHQGLSLLLPKANEGITGDSFEEWGELKEIVLYNIIQVSL